MKTCFIEQSCGLGDILLSIKIGNHYSNLGYNVIWPVESTYNYINEYIAAPGVTFVDKNTEFKDRNEYFSLVSRKVNEVTEFDKCLHVPIKNSFFSAAGKEMMSRTSYHDYANMHGKFKMCSLNSEGWQDYFSIKRNTKKEQKLFSYLQLQNSRYHLINKNFGTPPRWREVLEKQISTPFAHKRVEMSMHPDFTIFDWLKVFEEADRIDTVSTSTFYLFEKLNLKCAPAIYSRNTSFRSYEENFGWLQEFARKSYIFIP